MQVMKTRKEVEDWRRGVSGKVGFVPTMGALHEGHLSLVRRARRESDVVVVSIFVNPTQFDDPRDFETYPRTLDRDLELLSQEGVDCVFVPDVKEMYPDGFEDEDAHYSFGRLERILEGAHRKGHFRGVAQVVAKLLRLIRPDLLYLGEKDYQQYLIIRRLIQDYLKMPVEVVLCPTVREPDGLACSSRNMRLSEEERRWAPYIYRSLLAIKDGYEKGLDLRSSVKVAREMLEEVPVIKKIDYLVVADAETLEEINDWSEAEHAYALVAVRMDNARLIDNLKIF